VWDIHHGYYFRSEGEGYLASACDEDEHPRSAPVVDPERRDELAAKLVRHAPALAGFAVARSWACLRTFAPDRRFVIGAAPDARGYVYVAGLGGHGVTTSSVIGALGARAVLDPGSLPAAFAPDREFGGAEAREPAPLTRPR